ncbi:MAG: ribonuclease III [Solirubrobacterales bacterium]|nr:ribonuclease III [Solirubrobacterales bacterium]
MQQLTTLLDGLPDHLATQVVTHASWTERRSESYARLAFLGDSVLGLAVTSHLFPRLEADRYGEGRLTKIRAQAVSGPACRAVAERLGVPERLAAAAPKGTKAGALDTERVLSSITEAIIGAVYLEHGYEVTAPAVVEAFAPEIEEALDHPVDFKSALQERLAQRALVVSYRVVAEHGPPHERIFDVEAFIDEEIVATGSGRSKKAAEQEAARAAVEQFEAGVKVA